MTDTPLPPVPPQPALPLYGGVPPQTPAKAILALVFGIVGLTSCCFPFGIVAWVLGKQAEREIRESGGTLIGEGVAKAGWITGAVGTALSVLLVLGYLLFFGVLFAVGGFEESSGY